MDPYSHLPTELKLKIASYLSSSDLAALASVNKAQGTVIQSRLYDAPEILQPDEGHRAMLLLRTLFARPRLFQKIRSLSLSIVYCLMPPSPGLFTDDVLKDHWNTKRKGSKYPFCAEYRSTKVTLIQLLSRRGVTRELYPRWFEMLENWYAACFYGGLVALSPNLECLSLLWYFKRTDGGFDLPHRDDSNQIQHAVLGQDHTIMSAWELPKLRSINLESGQLSWYWLRKQGKKLSCLRLSLHASLDYNDKNEINQINHLEVCVNLDDPLGISRVKWNACPYLAPLTNLKSVKLCLEYSPPSPFYQEATPYWEHSVERKSLEKLRDSPLGALILLLQRENSTLQGSKLIIRRRRPFHKEEYFLRARLTILLENLKASAPTLETLELVPANDVVMVELRLLDAIPPLAAFTKLRKLTLPFRPCTDSLAEILPPSLEELDLFCYAPMTNSFLDDLILHRREHGIFRRLKMFFECEKNVTVQNVDARFAKEGIEIYVYLRGHGLVQAMTAQGKTYSSQTWGEAPSSNVVLGDKEHFVSLS